MSRRPKRSARPAPQNPTDEDIARADKPCDPPISCGTMGDSNLVAMTYEPPITRLGRRLVEAALARLDHNDPDRAVTLTTTYIALVSEDERARA